MPRKASGRKAAKAGKKTADKSTTKSAREEAALKAGVSAKVDPASPEGQKIAELQRGIEDQQRIAQSKAKPNYGASTSTMGGVTKILREEGDEHTGKPNPTHIVQQGGGGAVDGASGQPLR